MTWIPVPPRRELQRREEERKLDTDKVDEIEEPVITYNDADVDALADKMVYWPEEFGIYRWPDFIPFEQSWKKGNYCYYKAIVQEVGHETAIWMNKVPT